VGNWYSNVQRLEEARDALTQALEFYEASDDRRGLADLHNRLGLVATLSGDMEQNRRSRLRAAEISEELEDLVQLSSSLVGLTHSAGAFQVWATAPAPGFTNTHALDSVERSIEAARSARWRSGEAYALAVRSLVRSWRGEYDLALDDAQSALSIASEIEHREWTAVSHLGLGLAHFSLLDYQLAVQAFEEAREVARSSGTPIFVIGADTGLVLARVAGGEYESAREITSRYAERTDLLPISLRSTRYAEALVAQAEGDADRALHLVNELYETAPYLSDPADIPLLARVRGKALADLGDEDAAIEALEAAIRGATADGPRIVAWEAHVDLAELYARANKRERAVQHYDAAIEFLNDIASLIQDSEVRAGFVDRAARLTRESRQDHGIS
jgi:tetratricopeptide (TPR) repeat protein